MPQTNNALLSVAVREAVQVAGALSYGTKIYPYDETVVRAPVRAVRVPPLKQWIVQKESFVQDVIKGYSEMADDELRQLIAGTGVGKTTQTPYAISSSFRVNGLILLPDNWSPAHAMKFIKKKYIELGAAVVPVILRASHANMVVDQPHVFFSSAVDFLARLALSPNLLQDLAIKYIFLDECHVKRPDYKVFEYLKATAVIGDVKVFYGTATGPSDISLENNSWRTVQKVHAKHYNLFALDALTPESPIYFERIVARTLIFCASDPEIDNVRMYYDKHDVPVLTISHSASSLVLDEIDRFLETNPLCVLAVPARFSTSFTFNVDDVHCTGYMMVLKSDFMLQKITLDRQPVTSAIRIQQMGRVGRYKPGRAFYADVECSAEPAVDYDVQFYVFLWLKLFNVVSNEPTITAFETVARGLTSVAVAMLLHARVPPMMLLPYIATNGFYNGWDSALKHVLYSNRSMPSDDSNEDRVGQWKTYSTGPVDYHDTPISFRSPIAVPRELIVLPAVAWLHYHEHFIVSAPSFDTRSVITAVQDIGHTPKRHSRVASQYSMRAPEEDMLTTVTRRSTVRFAPTRKSLDSMSSVSTLEIPRKTDVVDTVRTALSTATMVPDFTKLNSSAVMQLQRDNIDEWNASVTRDMTPRSLSSGSSDNDVHLVAVNPKSYPMHKFYPMDSTLFQQYVTDSQVTRRDSERVERLITNKADFSRKAANEHQVGTTQSEYFLSILRYHNAALVRYLQVVSRAPRTLFKRILNNEGNTAGAEREKILESAKLLFAVRVEGFLVGIDSRSLAGLHDSVQLSPIYDEFQAAAHVSMTFGDIKAAANVEQLKSTFEPCVHKGRFVANAWWFGTSLVMMQHVYEPEAWNYLENHRSVFVEGTDLMLLRDEVHAFSYGFDIREPKMDEEVYVLLFSQIDQIVIVLGNYHIYGDIDYAYIDCAFPSGTSGAMIVAIEDGALLAFYVGPIDADSGRVQWASVLKAYF